MTMTPDQPIPNLRTPSENSELTSLGTKDALRLISWAMEKYEQAKSDRWKNERQWYLNMAFYFGQQNVAFKGGVNEVSRDFQLYTPAAPYYRSRPVINQIRPRIRTEMAKLTAQKPSAFIVPAG